MGVLFPQFLSETVLILRKTERDKIQMYVGPHVKGRSFLSDFKETLISSAVFSKNISTSNLIKLCQLAAELVHADRRTDGHDKVNSRFSQFLNRA